MDHIIITKPCTVQDWANAMKARTDSANHHMAIDALAALLDDKASPFNAAEKITMAYEDSLKALSNPDDSGNDISTFYALYLCDAIRTFGGASRRLLDLLVEISKRPDAKHVDGSPVKHRNGSVYWRDLPSWAYNFLEYGLRYDDPGDFSFDEIEDYYAQAPFLLNATRFAATLLEQGRFAGGFLEQADMFLQVGIEQSYHDASRIKPKEWQVPLPSATTWLLVAGKTIYSCCLLDEVDYGRRGRRRLWNRSLWERWKARLQSLAVQLDIDETCRALASQTVMKMAEIEKGAEELVQAA